MRRITRISTIRWLGLPQAVYAPPLTSYRRVTNRCRIHMRLRTRAIACCARRMHMTTHPPLPTLFCLSNNIAWRLIFTRFIGTRACNTNRVSSSLTVYRNDALPRAPACARSRGCFLAFLWLHTSDLPLRLPSANDDNLRCINALYLIPLALHGGYTRAAPRGMPSCVVVVRALTRSGVCCPGCRLSASCDATSIPLYAT